MPIFSEPRFIYLFFISIAAVLLWRKGKNTLIVACGALIFMLATDFVCGQILKPLVGRPRPFRKVSPVYIYQHHHWQKLLYPLKPLPRGRSFPSCHASNVSCVATIFTCFAPELAPVLWSFVAAVMYSRLYLGVHYPLDVLAGLLVGLVMGIMGFRLIDLLRSKR